MRLISQVYKVVAGDGMVSMRLVDSYSLSHTLTHRYIVHFRYFTPWTSAGGYARGG